MSTCAFVSHPPRWEPKTTWSKCLVMNQLLNPRRARTDNDDETPAIDRPADPPGTRQKIGRQPDDVPGRSGPKLDVGNLLLGARRVCEELTFVWAPPALMLTRHQGFCDSRFAIYSKGYNASCLPGISGQRIRPSINSTYWSTRFSELNRCSTSSRHCWRSRFLARNTAWSNSGIELTT